MSHPESSQQDRADNQAISRLFAHLIDGGEPGPDHTALYEEAEAEWESASQFELRQGATVGNFKREAVGYFLGSLPGLSIHIDVETPLGPKNVQLQVRGAVPNFEIKPVAVKAPELSVEPLNPEYACLPTYEAFDWQNIIRSAKSIRSLKDDPLYLVVFRSQLASGADTKALAQHDARAHAAAEESPALIHYFADTPNEEGRSLSFCLWEDAQAAKAASQDSRHRAATAMVSAYESYSLEKYDVHHAKGEVTLVPR